MAAATCLPLLTWIQDHLRCLVSRGLVWAIRALWGGQTAFAPGLPCAARGGAADVARLRGSLETAAEPRAVVSVSVLSCRRWRSGGRAGSSSVSSSSMSVRRVTCLAGVWQTGAQRASDACQLAACQLAACRRAGRLALLQCGSPPPSLPPSFEPLLSLVAQADRPDERRESAAQPYDLWSGAETVGNGGHIADYEVFLRLMPATYHG